MSSEEEAYEEIWRRLAEHAPMAADETLDVDEALNEWKQQIERRALAGQTSGSEEEAENALYELIVELSEAVPLDAANWPRAVVDARWALLQRLRDAVTTYKTHIERRVLAQQPCYGLEPIPITCTQMRAMVPPDKAHLFKLCTFCEAKIDTARAAQTQETSALPPTDS